jgi:RHS repeat-associated protein
VKSLLSFPALFSVALLVGLFASSLNAQTSVTDGRTPLGMSPGAPAGSYALSDLDEVSLFSGNLSFNVPLITIGGRGSAGYTMTLRPNQNRFRWRVVHNIQQTCNQNGCTIIAHTYYPSENWWATLESQPGYRPGVLIGRKGGESPTQPGGCPNGTSVWSSTLTRITFSTGDGTEYELRDQLLGGQPQPLPGGTCGGQAGLRGKIFVTGDGTAVTLISDTNIYDSANNPQTFYPSGYLLFRDGTRYRIDNGSVSWIRDRNGNQVTFSPAGTITDSIKRVVTYSYGEPDVITFKGFGGATRTIQVSHASLSTVLRPCRPDPGYQCFSIQTYKQLFPASDGSSVTTFNPSVVSAVTLPDGRQYRFYYNSYAELARVDLPTGGTIEYDYAAGAGSDSSGLTSALVGSYIEKAIYRRVVERRIYADGQTLEGRTTYSIDTNPTIVDHLKPTGELLSREKHYFYGDPRTTFFLNSNSYGLWNDGREYKTQIFSGDGVTELLRHESNWQQGCAVSSWSNLIPNNPRIADTTSTLEPSGANQVSKQVLGYDCYNNLTDKYEYDFGSGVPAANYTRRIHTDYLTTNPVNGASYDTLNPNSTAPDINATYHLRNLARRISVYDSGGTERARSTIEYDNYVLDGSDCLHGFHCPLTARANISGLDSAFSTTYTTRGNATASTNYLLTNGTVTGSVSAYSHYDVAGNVIRSIDPRSTSSNYIVTTIEYDDRFGAPDNEARGNTVPSELTGFGSFAFPTKVINPLGHTGYAQFDYYLGKPVNAEDANAIVASGSFNDALDRPTQIHRAYGTSAESQTTFAYDDTNRIITTSSDRDAYNDQILVSKIVYDQMGRTIETRQYEGGANYIVTERQYDALGRAYKTSNPYRRWQSETAIWTTQAFDALGRVISVTTPDGSIVNTSFSGNSVAVTDQAGKARKSVTDALGRLTNVSEDPNGVNYQTTYTYDVLDNLTIVTQGTQTRTFVYDSLKRLRSATNPESGTITYDYDNNSNLTFKTDARGVVTENLYDALNRVTTILYRINGQPDPNTGDVEYLYDNATNGKGRLWLTYRWGAKPSHTAVGLYDALGRVTQLYQLFGDGQGGWSAGYEIDRTYNLAGGVTSQSYPSGHSVTYNYDAAGRATSLTGNLGDGVQRTYSTGISYVPSGALKQEQFGTTVPVYNKLFYNSRLQLAEILASTTGGDSSWNRGKIINGYSLQCSGASCNATDNNGNLRKQQVYIPADDQVSSSTTWYQQYDYDNLNRLQRVQEYTPSLAWQQEYVYDRWGNRTIHQTNTWGTGINKKNFTVNTATNRLDVPAGQSGAMTYDAAGNLTTDSYIGYGSATFDGDNRIVAAQDSYAGWSYYTYNADGQRVRRKINNQETWQIYGMDGELLAEYPANATVGSPQKEYGYRNGQLLVTAEAGTRINVALASNGGTATASSTLSPYVPAYVINGSRRATNSEGWLDNTYASFPDWVQVDFNGSKTISEIDVVTQQDDPQNPVEPTLTQTFSLYGITAFDAQYWTGSAWATVPGGSVTGNNKVWRQFSFSPITTTKIRVVVNAGADNAFSRVVEVEAWTGPGPTNYALTANGGTATASSTLSPYVPAYVINGSRRATNSDVWLDSTYNSFPDWVQVDFNGSKTISEIDVITQQDDPQNPIEPTLTQTFSLYGITAFDVQYWTGSAWATVPGGSVTGNNKVWRQFTFSPITTTNIRVVVNAGADNAFSRVIEVEAWGGESGGTASNIHWLVSDHLGTPRMIFDQSGSLANVKRHDYLPFGEELFAPTGLRTIALGYSGGDGVRQQFTSKERDFETGLDYFLTRYYASTQGRFTLADPLSALASAHPNIPQSWNSYTYVLNNPLKLVDPDGLMWVYHYIDKEKTKIGIAWIEGNKIPKDRAAEGYKALDFGGQSSRDVRLTDGSVVRLNANSGNPLQLQGPQQSGSDGGYVNTGLIRELGRQTAPMPAATAAFILISLNGGYLVAGSSIALLDAAGFALYAVHEVSQNDAAVMATTSSQYQDVTNPRSIRNIKTDVSKADFIKNMEASGYKATRSGNAVILDNGVNRYTVYDVARSTGGPTAVRSVGGEQTLKIRLKP